MQRTSLFLLITACLTFMPAPAQSKSKDTFWMYVGTYTGPKSEGIYVYRFDSKTGALTSAGLAAKAASPSFLAIAPDEKVLYAVSESREGTVESFTIDKSSGKLAPINQVSSKGNGPCFVSVDKTGRTVMVANYGSGTIASYKVDEGGHLSEAVSTFQHKGASADKERQGGPHAHSINPSPDNRFAIAADLGTDELKVYKLDAATGTLSPNTPPATNMQPGDGPRHFTFHPKKPLGYVINEMHSTVTALHWNASQGTLEPFDTVSTLPADYKGDTTTAEVQIHPNGKWLYGSNRGHDSIAVFEILGDGKLKLVQNAPTGGSLPRNFRIDPTGKWLVAANMKGNNMTVFQIDSKSGKLTAKGSPVELSSPVCLKFVPMS